MLSIGEFSRATSLSLKALRLYHEQGFLIPSIVDRETSYRYYDFKDLERARIIARLRELMFSLDEIKEILSKCSDDHDTVAFLVRQQNELEARIKEYKRVTTSINTIIQKEREAAHVAQKIESPKEATVPRMLVASIKTIGRYEMSSANFSKLGREFGRYINGKPLNLYFDSEYKEEGAIFESCMPIRKAKKVEGIDVKELPSVLCLSLLHTGPYIELGRTYARAFSLMNERGYKSLIPSREIYIKGPGMLFKGNPKNYLTEIQIVIANAH